MSQHERKENGRHRGCALHPASCKASAVKHMERHSVHRGPPAAPPGARTQLPHQCRCCARLRALPGRASARPPPLHSRFSLLQAGRQKDAFTTSKPRVIGVPDVLKPYKCTATRPSTRRPQALAAHQVQRLSCLHKQYIHSCPQAYGDAGAGEHPAAASYETGTRALGAAQQRHVARALTAEPHSPPACCATFSRVGPCKAVYRCERLPRRW